MGKDILRVSLMWTFWIQRQQINIVGKWINKF